MKYILRIVTYLLTVLLVVCIIMITGAFNGIEQGRMTMDYFVVSLSALLGIAILCGLGIKYLSGKCDRDYGKKHGRTGKS